MKILALIAALVSSGILVNIRVHQNVTSCNTTPPRATGTTYYYCDCGTGAVGECVAGSDVNAGTSAALPRRTLGDASTRFGSMANGSTVALCRGGAWASGFGALPGKTCGTTDATKCDLRDYIPSWGSQATAKPLVAANGTLLNLGNDGDVANARIWNLHFRATSFTDDGQIQIYGNNANGLDFCNVTVEGGKVGFNIQPGATTVTSTIRESTITLIGQTGIYHAASNWTFDSNLFLNNQQATSAQCGGGFCGQYYNHDHYVSGTASNVVIRNSEYYADSAHCSTSAERCDGVMIYWTDFQTDPVFENNYVHGAGTSNHFGLSSSNNAANTSNYNGIIRRNRWELPAATCQVEISACTGCQFLDNVVIGTNQRGLCTPDQTGQSTPVNSGTVARNNAFYFTGAGTGITQNAEGSDYIFENNVAYVGVGGTCFNITRPLASGHPYTVTTYPSTTTNTAGNYCVNDGSAASVVFTNAAGGNFTPVNPGPLIGTANQTYYSATAIGTVAWSATDTGSARSPPIDIGALKR